MYAFIKKDLLLPYQEVLPSLEDEKWNLSKQPKIWSDKRIDGEMMYKIHRHSSRIVDETGLIVQNQVYDVFGDSEKIFPFYYQIIKIEGEFSTPKLIDGMECQSLTFLNGKYENSTYIIEKGHTHSLYTEETLYAFAIMWSKAINEDTPKWFIRPYHRMFA
jgi:hypothetical protein